MSTEDQNTAIRNILVNEQFAKYISKSAFANLIQPEHSNPRKYLDRKLEAGNLTEEEAGAITNELKQLAQFILTELQ